MISASFERGLLYKERLCSPWEQRVDPFSEIPVCGVEKQTESY